MNPFTNKSLPEIKAMVPGLSDGELDALCAEYCDGRELKHYHGRLFVWDYLYDSGFDYPKAYTTDGREAMRLLAKYEIQVGPVFPNFDAFSDDVHSECVSNPCRAIAEAALVAELQKRINLEEAKDCES